MSAPKCAPGKHRTLVMIEVEGEKLKGRGVPYICLNCGTSFAVVQVKVDDKDIDTVLELAAEQTRDNLKKLRVKQN